MLAGGAAALPPVVVAIGPVTAAAAARHGIAAATADPHSLEGLVEATVAALRVSAAVSDGAGPIEGLVFDLDGTIADTESVEYEAIRMVWADHGLDYPVDRWSHVVGQAWSPGWVAELEAEADVVVDRGAARAAKGRHHGRAPGRAGRRGRASPT